MLIECPECKLPVSDKALSCPHCGLPLKEPSKYKRSPKRMRLPNGFGQISEIKNRNLRNPFRAMVTTGFSSTGHPITQMLKPQAYFKTYNEAYAALAEYHKNPYDLNPSITVEQLYEEWFGKYKQTLKSASSVRTITAAWAYCGSVYSMRVKDLRARHIKGCMEDGTANINGTIKVPSIGTQQRIKSLFNIMLDYAVEYELVDKNYARTFDVSTENINEQERSKRSHMPFTESEMEILWQNVNTPWVSTILIQCYTGFRPQELGLLLVENINDGFIKGGMKTEAGTDRLVPIHSKISILIDEKVKEAAAIGSPYLINCTDGKDLLLTYDKYQLRFKNVIKELGLNPEHRAHDPRVHFVTMAKKYQLDEYAIKYIVGHAVSDVTEKVYAKRDVAWLKAEIEKIK